MQTFAVKSLQLFVSLAISHIVLKFLYSTFFIKFILDFLFLFFLGLDQTNFPLDPFPSYQMSKNCSCFLLSVPIRQRLVLKFSKTPLLKKLCIHFTFDILLKNNISITFKMFIDLLFKAQHSNQLLQKLLITCTSLLILVVYQLLFQQTDCASSFIFYNAQLQWGYFRIFFIRSKIILSNSFNACDVRQIVLYCSHVVDFGFLGKIVNHDLLISCGIIPEVYNLLNKLTNNFCAFFL